MTGVYPQRLRMSLHDVPAYIESRLSRFLNEWKQGFDGGRPSAVPIFDLEPAPDRTGAVRDAIVFELRALEAVAEKVEAESAPSGMTLQDLRQLAFSAATESSHAPSQGKRNVYQRSRDVRIYVLARANGKCEGRNALAPFVRSDGTPYLEPHHLGRLSDGGPDHPAHVIALCPNCHRRVHAGADGEMYNAKLNAMMAAIEP